jgi:2-polyprenyl-3-methyl-5-hydroxy-6-metoxy-1,4-benzoquinol methylase
MASSTWLRLLVDPIDRLPLHFDDRELIAANGIRYPIIEGIPVLIRADLPPTHRSSTRTVKMSELARQGLPIDPVFAVNLPEQIKESMRREIASGCDPAEAVIRRLVPLTNGGGYRNPTPGDAIAIPIFPESGAGQLLLDLGCSWGRWTIAAARAGFRAIGIDPMIGHLIAAKRFAASRGFEVDYICADARCLPFLDGAFDRVFSYSVLQHFSDADCVLALREIGRVLKPSGASTIQMAHRVGVRSFWHQFRRGFRAPTRFEVRYRSLPHMTMMFADAIGPTSAAIDCFFGLGLQASDIAHMRPLGRAATMASEHIKRLARTVPALRAVADSLFMHSTKLPQPARSLLR